MCELSFAKCVCLLFILVNVAILSSFGYRIDNSDTAMPSIGVTATTTTTTTNNPYNLFNGHKFRHSRKFLFLRPSHHHLHHQQQQEHSTRSRFNTDLEQERRQELMQEELRPNENREVLQQEMTQGLLQEQIQELTHDRQHEMSEEVRQQLPQEIRQRQLQQDMRQVLQHDSKHIVLQERNENFQQVPKTHHIPSGRIEMSVLLPPPLQSYTLQDTHQIISSNNEESYLRWPLHMARPQRSPSTHSSQSSTTTTSSNQRTNTKSNRRQTEHIQRQQRKRFCQEKDVARNAYLANTVVLARAESMSSNRVTNYSVTFRILKKFKSKYRLDDTLRLTFLNDNNKRIHCEPDFYSSSSSSSSSSKSTSSSSITNGGKIRGGLVKAKIQQSKEYYLFLNSDGMHRYTVQGMPVLKRKKLKGRKDIIEVTIKKITDNKFVLKEPNKPMITRSERLRLGENLKISCQIKGFPIPYLTWKKDGVVLRQNESVRITYKRRKTTLKIIKVKTKDLGRYECIATGLDNRVANESVDIQINSEEKYGEECAEHLKDTYCLNGGTCYKNAEIQEAFCVCGEGFAGDRCQQKEVMKSSSTYTCKLGISTSYYC